MCDVCKKNENPECGKFWNHHSGTRLSDLTREMKNGNYISKLVSCQCMCFNSCWSCIMSDSFSSKTVFLHRCSMTVAKMKLSNLCNITTLRLNSLSADFCRSKGRYADQPEPVPRSPAAVISQPSWVVESEEQRPDATSYSRMSCSLCAARDAIGGSKFKGIFRLKAGTKSRGVASWAPPRKWCYHKMECYNRKEAITFRSRIQLFSLHSKPYLYVRHFYLDYHLIESNVIDPI